MKLLFVWLVVVVIAIVGSSVEAAPKQPAVAAVTDKKPESANEKDGAALKRQVGWGWGGWGGFGGWGGWGPGWGWGPAAVPYPVPAPAWRWGGWGGW